MILHRIISFIVLYNMHCTHSVRAVYVLFSFKVVKSLHSHLSICLSASQTLSCFHFSFLISILSSPLFCSFFIYFVPCVISSLILITPLSPNFISNFHTFLLWIFSPSLGWALHSNGSFRTRTYTMHVRVRVLRKTRLGTLTNHTLYCCTFLSIPSFFPVPSLPHSLSHRDTHTLSFSHTLIHTLSSHTRSLSLSLSLSHTHTPGHGRCRSVWG